MGEFAFEIVEHIGVIAEYGNGWRKEVNMVSWCHAEPKLDIRDWSPDHAKMAKGLTFTEDEAKQMETILHSFMEGR